MEPWMLHTSSPSSHLLVSLRSKEHLKRSKHWRSVSQCCQSIKLTGGNKTSCFLVVCDCNTPPHTHTHVPSVGYTVNHPRLYFSTFCTYLATHWCMISSSCLCSWVGSVHILRTELWLLLLIYGTSCVCVECLLPWRRRNSLLSIFVDVLIKLTFSNKCRCAAVCIHRCCFKRNKRLKRAEISMSEAKRRQLFSLLYFIVYRTFSVITWNI